MTLKSVSSAFIGIFLSLVGFCGLIVVMGLLVRPDMSAEPPAYSAAEIAAAAEARKIEIDPANPVRLQVDVDYDKGKSAAWYPKGEAPMLAEMVAEGQLPPVAERVGPEPVVLRGVDGIGVYGGTWTRMAGPSRTIVTIGARLSYTTLVRFSPHGFPLVPHVAKSYEVSSDNREFTFTLRKGMKWSDGHLFTTDDILYWWEHECNDKAIKGTPPTLMKVKGKPGSIEKIDDHKFKITFPEPNGMFLAKLATWDGSLMLTTPAHYLRQYHPTLGDKDIIDRRMEARGLNSPKAVYLDVKDEMNLSDPEHPRLWPWIYRTYKSNPPQVLVRNPYYFAVDEEGNQLPYMDRLVFEVKSPKMRALSVANGEATMQARGMKYDRYTLLMSSQAKRGYRVFHWYPGDRSDYCLYPNLNKRYTDTSGVEDPVDKQKHDLLNDKRFRQALSMAINRRDIIAAEYDGQTDPAQVSPGPASYFHHEGLYKSYTQYDPAAANELLDDIGLTDRDLDGYRTLPDGSTMTFLINFCSFTGIGPGEFIVDDWAAVGIRTILRDLASNLYYSEKAAFKPDFTVWSSNGEFYPLIEPRCFIAFSDESNFAQGWARWYERGGLYGDPAAADSPGAAVPPPGHPMREAMALYNEAMKESDPARQKEVFSKVQDIAAENLWTINICTPPPVLAVVKNGLKNVPETLVYSWDFQSPGNGAVETWYLEDRPELRDSPEAITQAQASILKPVLPPDVPAAAAPAAGVEESGNKIGSIVKYAVAAVIALLVVMVGLRHPYVGRRLLIMVPTLLLISVVAFVIIQLPPSNFVATRIMELQQSGDAVDAQQIRDLEEMFYFKDYSKDPVNGRTISSLEQYVRWMGLKWFTTGDQRDKGLLQGNLGRSMETQKSVNSVVGDRILLTVLISFGTILLTWTLAIPIGIYSAVRQYSPGDYFFTLLGFLGMCVPPFLLALLLMYFSAEVLGIPVSGLFSSRYGAQPEWDWPKVLDLLKHIWVPIVVLGVGGTAWMIRVMRANLLDELNKPYVTTARAKGVRPMKLLFKYPVRIAMNPFVSGIGGLFPQLLSGGAIVGIVLSLPTVGPLMLNALMAEDMYLAGSMLMVLSLLAVVGTLVSDLLLLWMDPRIRMQGGQR